MVTALVTRHRGDQLDCWYTGACVLTTLRRIAKAMGVNVKELL
jgi:hypothetical protein